MSDRPAKERNRRRLTITAYAACGMHGKPWCHMSGPGAATGQLAIFDSPNAARKAHGDPVHQVKIYVEVEPYGN